MRLVSFVLCGLLVGCSDDNPTLDVDPFPYDPNDPVICVGDPDGAIVCKKESEFWDCTTMPNGDVKCVLKEPQTPGGGATWSCTVEGDQIVCKSKDATGSPDGSSGWSCTQDAEFLVCTKDAPIPPSGGSSWSCALDGEFNWVCTTKDGKPPTQPDTPLPPGGGTFGCYEVAPGSMTGLPTPPEGYWAKVMAKKVLYNGVDALYIKLWLTKAFVDNTYGNYAVDYRGGPTNTRIGGGHEFHDLEESDKMEIFVDDTKGNLAFHMALDYISVSSSAPSGHASLGVTGGDGAMLKGNASDVMAVQTSLAMNFNGYGYVLTKDSPKTDLNYTPDPAYPKWIFDVWYEAWVKWSAFGSTGPGKVYITGLHASPNKITQRSLEMVPVPCLP